MKRKIFIIYTCFFCLSILKVYSQCDLKVSEDKFTKVTVKTNYNSLNLNNDNYNIILFMTLIGDRDLDFNIYNKHEREYFTKMTILFTDGLTIDIGDKYEQLHLNTGIDFHNEIIEKLQRKKIEAIRLYKDGKNYDFDLPVNNQNYFIINLNCLFKQN